MRYWDSSALLPLLVQETTTATIQALAKSDGDLLTWWGSRVEAAFALACLAREGALSVAAYHSVLAQLGILPRPGMK